MVVETRRRKRLRILGGECWQSLPDEIVLIILSNLDARSLIERKAVCRKWRRLCTQVIYAKQTKVFETRQELRHAVRQYVIWYNDPQVDVEELAKYGWPIGKWNVSNIQDFSFIFSCMKTFNEDISQWDVSNATTMLCMFEKAFRFNQDISNWTVSNVTTMQSMFLRAIHFNQSLGGWDTSNVTTMSYMFHNARDFNQNLSSWEVGNVTMMNNMFVGATNFVHNVESWGWNIALFDEPYVDLFDGDSSSEDDEDWY